MKRLIIALVVVCQMALLSHSFSQQIDAEMAKRSSVVFVGTISKLNAATFAQVPVSENTAIVKVTQLLQKPALLSMKEGDEITLQLQSSTGFNAGSEHIFYADGWILGSGIALREIGHSSIPRTESASARAVTQKNYRDMRKQLTEARVHARMDSAEVVALGKITSIRSARVTEAARPRITEHDPNWQEAILKVSNGMKGCRAGDEIVLRFPASMDVAYYGVPKFKDGDEKIVMLRKDTRSGLLKASHMGKDADAFIVDSPADVFGKEQLEQLQNLMRRR
jgi:hypothetical protein